MADGGGSGSGRDAADWEELGARPKTLSRKEKKKEKEKNKWQYGSGSEEAKEGEGEGSEQGNEGEEKKGRKKKGKMEVVGGRGEEVATVTRSSRAKWATGYGSEEDAWLVAGTPAAMARNMVRREREEAEFRRWESRRRLDLVDRLAQLNIEGNEFEVCDVFLSMTDYFGFVDDQRRCEVARGSSPSVAEREAPVDVADRLAQFHVEGMYSTSVSLHN